VPLAGSLLPASDSSWPERGKRSRCSSRGWSSPASQVVPAAAGPPGGPGSTCREHSCRPTCSCRETMQQVKQHTRSSSEQVGKKVIATR
jgi:hypothetical protein